MKVSDEEIDIEKADRFRKWRSSIEGQLAKLVMHQSWSGIRAALRTEQCGILVLEHPKTIQYRLESDGFKRLDTESNESRPVQISEMAALILEHGGIDLRMIEEVMRERFDNREK